MRGKIVTVIGQSNLCGKPLVAELIKQEATVYSCNEFTNKEEIKNLTDAIQIKPEILK